MAAGLTYRFSAMNAGKSTALLQLAHSYQEQGMGILLFTAELDNRVATGVIASRLGVQKDATTFTHDSDFTKLLGAAVALKKATAILIDEAQFLTSKQVTDLHQFANTRHVAVICFGLRTDFQGETFEGSARLLALADDIDEIKTVCSCGRKATMTARFGIGGNRVTQGPQLMIGGNDRYRAMCSSCFYKGIETAHCKNSRYLEF